MNGKIWLDGKFVDWDSGKVHVLSHSLHYGSAVFEGIRAYGGTDGVAIFRLNDHVDRLFSSSSALGMKIPFSKKEISSAIISLVKQGGFETTYIRPLVFYSGEYIGFDMSKPSVSVAICALEWDKYAKSKEISAQISPYRKPKLPLAEMESKISGYYALSLLALNEAKKRGFESAILLDNEGFIAEGPIENVFMAKNGRLYTPKRGTFLLGLTRDTLFSIAKDLKIPLIEKKITPNELKSADEVFFTGTGSELIAITKVDKKRIGSGKKGEMTLRLEEEYSKIIHGKNKRYGKWLTPIS